MIQWLIQQATKEGSISKSKLLVNYSFEERKSHFIGRSTLEALFEGNKSRARTLRGAQA